MTDQPKGDGENTDLATGKPIHIEKPEEKVRQAYERKLHDDYGYDYALMGTEVSMRRGSQVMPERADIVIYNSITKRDQHTNIEGIVETKKPARKDGIKQLKTYMSASAPCYWGVWTNQDDIAYIYRDVTTNILKDDFISNIPLCGESIEDIGKLSKDNLIQATNLKAIYNRVLTRLYATSNVSMHSLLGRQLIRIIFCKIYDENHFENQLPEFRRGTGESVDDVKDRIDALFEAVKKEVGTDDVFASGDVIGLDSKSVAYVVGELMMYSLKKTESDVVGDAFEVFVEGNLLGEKGAFFTPREVVKTAIEIVNPNADQTVLDPACGSGGFLIYALEHIWKKMAKSKKYAGSNIENHKKRVAETHFFGIDKDADLVNIAKAYMSMVGDGRSKIVRQDSLVEPNDFGVDYPIRAKDVFIESGKLKKFDIIMTNPPFGTDIKIPKEQAGHFQLGRTSPKKGNPKPKATPPQELFIERCLEMLKDRGTLAIILPETYLFQPSTTKHFEFMQKNNNIKAIVDLDHDTFRPHNNAKAVLIVLEKNVPQQDEIVMAVAAGTGHDHGGRVKYRYDSVNNQVLDGKDGKSEEIWDDTKIIREELKDPGNTQNKNTFTLKKKDITHTTKDPKKGRDILIPRAYWQNDMKEIENIAKKKNLCLVSVADLLNNKILFSTKGHGSPSSEYKGKGDIPYVRVSDIVNWDIYDNYTARIPEAECDRVIGKKAAPKLNDILFVRRGSYRIGTVALVPEKFASPHKALFMGELQIFRVLKNDKPYWLSPSYLLFLFSHELVQRQLARLTYYDTTLPQLGDRWKELRLPLFKTEAEVKKVTKVVDKIFENKQEVLASIKQLSSEHGKLTT